MKKTMTFVCMAALVAMGAILVGCAKNEVNDQHSELQNLTSSITVGFSDDEDTKALTSAGVKTFAAGDKIAVIYKNTSDQTIKAVSAELPSGSYGKTASFSVTLTNPQQNSAVRVIYPASMAKDVAADATINNDDATVDFAALETQDGTLSTLGSNYDLCVFDGNLSGTDLPTTATLANKLAILAIIVRNSNTTKSVKNLTIMEMGGSSYSISRNSASSEPFYVAIRPTSNADISVVSDDKPYEYYAKYLTSKTYEASHLYNLGWNMTRVEREHFDTKRDSGADDFVGTYFKIQNHGPVNSYGTQISLGGSINITRKDTNDKIIVRVEFHCSYGKGSDYASTTSANHGSIHWPDNQQNGSIEKVNDSSVQLSSTESTYSVRIDEVNVFYITP